MKLFRVSDLRALAERRQWPCVSLFLPMHRTGRKDTRENPIRLKNAAGEARERLIAAGYPKDHAAEMLDPANDLIASRDFWLHQSDGLAVFATPDLFEYYRLPLTLRDEAVVADHFAIKQLIPLFTEDGRFYILALSQKHIRFFMATRTGIQEHPVPDMLKNIDDLRRLDETEEHLRGHSISPTPGAMGTATVALHSYGTAADKAADKADVQRYVQAVCRRLEKHLNGETAPLVLAAVEYEQAFYRQENTYPHLLARGVLGNPDGLNEDEIHQVAWETVEPHFAQARQISLGHFNDLSNTDKTSDKIEEILPAAANGRVRALYLRTDVPVWGRFDPATLAVEAHDAPRDGDTDLLCLAAIYVLQNKGTTYAVHKEDLPTDSPQAAMFRY